MLCTTDFSKTCLVVLGSMTFHHTTPRLCCNQGCKVIKITNIEATKATRCSCKGVCICLIIGTKVHSAKAAASKVCHLLWVFPLIAPSQDTLTHTFWEAGCHSRGCFTTLYWLQYCTNSINLLVTHHKGSKIDKIWQSHRSQELVTKSSERSGKCKIVPSIKFNVYFFVSPVTYNSF